MRGAKTRVTAGMTMMPQAGITRFAANSFFSLSLADSDGQARGLPLPLAQKQSQ